MPKTKRKSTANADRKQKRLVSFNSAPRKSVRQRATRSSGPATAAATAPPLDEHSQLILDTFGFENASSPSVPPPSSKKKQKARKEAAAASRKATPRAKVAALPRRSPRLRKSLSLIEEADEKENHHNNEAAHNEEEQEEESPIKPPNKRRKVTPENRTRKLVVRDTFDGTPDSENEEPAQIGGEIMAVDDASWRPTGRKTRSSARRTPSSRQRKGKDDKVQNNTLTQMSRHFHWNSDFDDEDYDSEEITVLSPSKPPNILNMQPSTPQRTTKTVIPSSRDTATPLSILRSGGKLPRNTQTSPSKKVRWKDIEDQENDVATSPTTRPSSREGDEEKVIPSSQWWENYEDQSPSQWDVDEVPAEDEHIGKAAVLPIVDDLESQMVENDDIPKTNFSRRLQQAAETSPRELMRLSPQRRESWSPTPEIEIVKATPSVEVENTPTSPRRPTQHSAEAGIVREEVADSQDEDDENDWEFVPEQNEVAVQESQVVVPASVENTGTPPSHAEESEPLGSSPTSAVPSPSKSKPAEEPLISLSQNSVGIKEEPETAGSPDYSVIFETPSQTQSQIQTQSQSSPANGITQMGGSSQFWDITGQSSGMVQSSPPPPHSSFTQQGFTQWKLNKFGPTQPSITVSQILGHSYSQDNDDEETEEENTTPKGRKQVQVQSSMLGSEIM